jgi:hypothetical protein
MRVYPKYSGLVPPSLQQLCYREAPADGRTTMSSESVCHVARSWVEVGSFHTRLVVRFKIFTASVRNILDIPSYLDNSLHKFCRNLHLCAIAYLYNDHAKNCGMVQSLKGTDTHTHTDNMTISEAWLLFFLKKM